MPETLTFEFFIVRRKTVEVSLVKNIFYNYALFGLKLALTITR
jgi:hypothetical protein